MQAVAPAFALHFGLTPSQPPVVNVIPPIFAHVNDDYNQHALLCQKQALPELST